MASQTQEQVKREVDQVKKQQEAMKKAASEDVTTADVIEGISETIVCLSLITMGVNFFFQIPFIAVLTVFGLSTGFGLFFGAKAFRSFKGLSRPQTVH